MQPIIIIPSRLAAKRLPNKPLLNIAGEAMIVHCWKRAVAANIGPVLVAAGNQEIVAAILDAGGQALLTKGDHTSGSDRIFEALQRFDPKNHYDVIVNLQGDLPTIDPDTIRACLKPLDNPACDIASVVAEIDKNTAADNPHIVKAICAFADQDVTAPALAFTRSLAPFGAGPYYHHIGIYAYRRSALEKFIALPQSLLEKREGLEQLRALENGLRIHLAQVRSIPVSIDTQDDLQNARIIMTK